jgi:rubrerythrin
VAGAQTGPSPDVELAAFIQSFELTAAETYEALLDRLGDEVRPVAEAFAQHHRDHAHAFTAIIGPEGTNRANAALTAELGPQVSAARTESAALALAFDLEQAAASSYLAAIGALETPRPAATAASILPIEAAHAVVLGQALGRPLGDYVPVFETVQSAADPATYPL